MMMKAEGSYKRKTPRLYVLILLLLLHTTVVIKAEDLCYDNSNFEFFDNQNEAKYCDWLTARKVETRNAKYCALGHIKSACRGTCNFCNCENDSDFLFPKIAHPDELRDCDWIDRSSKPEAVERRRERYCYEGKGPNESLIASDIGSKCAKSCGFCTIVNTAESCREDDETFTFHLENGNEESCSWLAKNKVNIQTRFDNYCYRGHIKAACGTSCKFCSCRDNYYFKFITKKGKKVRCNWITKYAVDSRRSRYCYENNDPKVASAIGNQCVFSCGFCSRSPSSTAPSLSLAPSSSVRPSSTPTISVAPSTSFVPTYQNQLQFSTFSSHACAVFLDKLQCVGDNKSGQLGTETQGKFGTPITFPSLSSAPVKVIAGSGFTCTLLFDGSVWCIGSNYYGVFGSASPSYSLTPVQVMRNSVPLSNVVDIVASRWHICATFTTRALYCWGYNYYGQLGYNDVLDGSSPEKKVKMMALSARRTCVVIESNPNEIQCIGKWPPTHSFQHDFGQEIMKITAGFYHYCVLLLDKTAYCWGKNTAGQLGDGTVYTRIDAINATTPFFTDIDDIFTGFSSTCFLSNNVPMCTGGSHTLLGISEKFLNESKSIDDKVLVPTKLNVIFPLRKMIASIHIGTNTGHVVFRDNTVYSWGRNVDGVLGDGSEDFNKEILPEEAAVQMKFDWK